MFRRLLFCLLLPLAGLAAPVNDWHPPVLLTKIAPEYPKKMLAAGIPGRVEVEFIVNTSGQVESARVVSSTGEAFEKPVLKAVRQARFQPATKQGKRVKLLVRQSIRFELEGEKPAERQSE